MVSLSPTHRRDGRALTTTTARIFRTLFSAPTNEYSLREITRFYVHAKSNDYSSIATKARAPNVYRSPYNASFARPFLRIYIVYAFTGGRCRTRTPATRLSMGRVGRPKRSGQPRFRSFLVPDHEINRTSGGGVFWKNESRGLPATVF